MKEPKADRLTGVHQLGLLSEIACGITNWYPDLTVLGKRRIRGLIARGIVKRHLNTLIATITGRELLEGREEE